MYNDYKSFQKKKLMYDIVKWKIIRARFTYLYVKTWHTRGINEFSRKMCFEEAFFFLMNQPYDLLKNDLRIIIQFLITSIYWQWTLSPHHSAQLFIKVEIKIHSEIVVKIAIASIGISALDVTWSQTLLYILFTWTQYT